MTAAPPDTHARLAGRSSTASKSGGSAMPVPHAPLNGATLADADAQTEAGTRDIDAARIELTAIRRWLQPCADAD
ncbi:hypothetical protein AAHH79_41620, partial [Burkholderia pseudomallei]